MKKIGTAYVFFLTTLGLWGHPHMFLQSAVQVNYQEGNPESITVNWWMDQFFSASLIHDYDANKDGKFSPAESRRVESEAFRNLENYGYFVLLQAEGPRFSPAKVQDFQALQEKDQVIYRFTVDLDQRFQGRDFRVAIFDNSFYCTLSYRDPALSFSGLEEGSPLPRWEVKENRETPIYYNPLGAANDKTVYTKWKPGLETAYPVELRVYAR